MIQDDSPSIGRFDKSFLIHMIKDFFIILVIVTVLEFSLKAALVYYNYIVDGENEASVVADDLSENVMSIMLNEGGPVAARTMYPILEKNWSDLGYVIAIEPSPVTVRSIRDGFGFVPMGIPAPEWPEGNFKSAELNIPAQEFCLACHTQANIGETLGTVTVRNYLSRDFAPVVGRHTADRGPVGRQDPAAFVFAFPDPARATGAADGIARGCQ